MAIAYHTHTFSVPTADAADLLAGTESGKVITPDVLGPVTPAGKALLSAANVAAQRAALDLEPGTDVQAYDADLAAIGALAKTDGNFIVGDGSTWVAESGATARASLGLAIGTDVQAYSANLDEYAAVNPTAAGLALLDDVDASAQRTTLGLAIGTDVQAHDADLTALAGLDKSDGNFIVGNGTTWVAESGATARTSLGLTIGTHVQAYSANLDSLASSAADGRNYLDTAPYVASRTALKALDTSKDTTAFLTEDGRESMFVFRSGDYSSEVTADTAENRYIAADAVATSAGAWVAEPGYFVSDRFPAYRRPLWAKLGDLFSALDAGVPNDGTDGTSEISDLLDYCIANTAVVDFPAGNYKITTTQTKTVQNDRALIWRGQGRGNVLFDLDTGGDGLSLTLPGNWWLDNRTPEGRTGLEISGMTFRTNNAGVGVGLELIGASAEGRPHPSVILDVEMRARDSISTQGWADMISMLDISYSQINNAVLIAQQSGGGRGIVIEGTAQANSPTSHHILHPKAVYGSDAIVIGSYVEGVYITQAEVVGAQRGVYQNAASTESGLHIVGGHFNCSDKCIYLRNMADFEIVGGLLFSSGSAAGNGGIVLENALRFVVTGNVLKGTGTGSDETGIYVVSSSNNAAHGGSIVGNIIHSYNGRGIWLSAGANYVDVGPNTYRGCAVNVLNQSTNNNCSIEPHKWSCTQQKTLTGGAASEDVTFTIPAGTSRLTFGCGLAAFDGAHSGTMYAEYLFGSSSATSAVFRVRRRDGTNIVGGTYRMSAMVSENLLASL